MVDRRSIYSFENTFGQELNYSQQPQSSPRSSGFLQELL